MLNSDRFEAGPHGLIVAIWLRPACRLELDLPNSRLCADGMIATTPPALLQSDREKKAKAKAKASAKGKAKKKGKGKRRRIKVKSPPIMLRPAAAYQVAAASEPAAEPEASPSVCIRIRPGHGLEQTLVVTSSSQAADKAHILAITQPAAATLSLTPLQLCARVCDDSEVKDFISRCLPPVRGAAWLAEARAIVRTVRDCFLEMAAAQAALDGDSATADEEDETALDEENEDEEEEEEGDVDEFDPGC